MERTVIIKKQEEVQALTEKMQASKTIVAFDYPGLSVFSFTELRNELRKAGCDVKVYKNNISRRASEAAGVGEFAEYLVGPKAIAFSESDVVAPAKVIHEFAKKNKAVQIQGGVVEGQVVGVEKIKELATLPSYETLLTMLAGSMLSPLTTMAVGLNLIVEQQEAQAA